MEDVTVGKILLDIWKQTLGTAAADTYDEVLREVAERAAQQHSLGKADIGALVVWKRLNASTKWAKNLMLTPDRDVREATGRAWKLANDESMTIPEAGGSARSELWGTPGLGGRGAIASAVLVALSPTRMAVWDRRAGSTLSAIGRHPEKGNGKYASYLRIVLGLADQMCEADRSAQAPSPREVDLVLFRAAGDPTALARLRKAASRADKQS